METFPQLSSRDWMKLGSWCSKFVLHAGRNIVFAGYEVLEFVPFRKEHNHLTFALFGGLSLGATIKGFFSYHPPLWVVEDTGIALAISLALQPKRRNVVSRKWYSFLSHSQSGGLRYRKHATCQLNTPNAIVGLAVSSYNHEHIR